MRKSGLTGDEAYALSKRRGTTEDLGPLKKEIGLLKEDLGYVNNATFYEILIKKNVDVKYKVDGAKPIFNNQYNLFMLQNTDNTKTSIYEAKKGIEYTIRGFGNNDELTHPFALFSPTLKTSAEESFPSKDGEKFVGNTSEYKYWEAKYTPVSNGYFYVSGDNSSVNYNGKSKILKKNNGVYMKNGVITHFIKIGDDKLLCREFKRFRINNLFDIYKMYIGKIENDAISILKELGTSDGDTIGPISIHRKDTDNWIGEWSGGVHGKTISGIEYPTAEQTSLKIICDGNEITKDGLYYGNITIIAENDLYFPQTITSGSFASATKAIEETRRYTLIDKMEVDVTIKPVADNFCCNRYYGCQFYKYDGITLYVPNSEKQVTLNPTEKFNFTKQENTVIMDCASGGQYRITLYNYGLGNFGYNDGTGELPFGYFETFDKGYFVPVGNKNVYMDTSKCYKWHGVYDYQF